VEKIKKFSSGELTNREDTIFRKKKKKGSKKKKIWEPSEKISRPTRKFPERPILP